MLLINFKLIFFFSFSDFDVELTAEVKVENGASLALLTIVTPNLGYQKPGRFKSIACLR